jgi:hypothetical protein
MTKKEIKAIAASIKGPYLKFWKRVFARLDPEYEEKQLLKGRFCKFGEN